MTVKRLFLQRNCKNCPATGGFAPDPRECNALELHQFVQHVAQLQHLLAGLF